MQALNRQNIKSTENHSPKVLEFGTGNFLRAFANSMIQTLNEKTDFKGSIIIVKPTPSESFTYKKLLAQEGLYHVITRGIANEKMINETKLITGVQQIVHPWLEFEKYLQLAEIPSLKIVISNTTEAGIVFQEFDNFSDRPVASFPGKLTQLLYKRFQHFEGDASKGWIFLPCELIEGNGQKLKNCVLQYAKHWKLGMDFESWIQKSNTFCDTLVDRIVPGFPKAEASEIQQQLGFEDQLLVATEPYHLWAIEAPQKVQEILPLDELGFNVQYTDDLSKFRTLKVRILNGAHTSMVAVGYLAGLETVRETVEASKTQAFIRELIFEEILSTLSFPKEELEKYANDVLDRFKNPFIHHKLLDISLNSISKFKTRVLPSLLAYHYLHHSIPNNMARSFAALIYFYKGEKNPLRDEVQHIEFFKNLWQDYSTSRDLNGLVSAVLSYENAWKKDLGEIEGLQKKVSIHLQGYINE